MPCMLNARQASLTRRYHDVCWGYMLCSGLACAGLHPCADACVCMSLLLLQEIMLPQIASWSAMWMSGLIICYGLRKKEQLRARLAANGQVWTAHENAARELMSLELEDMQQQVDKMSNEELAQVAMRMMEVSCMQHGLCFKQGCSKCTAEAWKRVRPGERDGPSPMVNYPSLPGSRRHVGRACRVLGTVLIAVW